MRLVVDVDDGVGGTRCFREKAAMDERAADGALRARDEVSAIV